MVWVWRGIWGIKLAVCVFDCGEEGNCVIWIFLFVENEILGEETFMVSLSFWKRQGYLFANPAL